MNIPSKLEQIFQQIFDSEDLCSAGDQEISNGSKDQIEDSDPSSVEDLHQKLTNLDGIFDDVC